MNAIAKQKIHLETNDSFRENVELFRTGQSAREFLREIVADTFPSSEGDLTLSINLDKTHEGLDCITIHLLLQDEFGGTGFLDCVVLEDFLNPIKREKMLFRLWRNLLDNRYRRIEARIEKLDSPEEEFADVQP